MFKCGDKVLCIGMNSGYSDKLEYGRIYTVAHCDQLWLRVEENNKINSYEIRYFEPIKFRIEFEDVP